MFLIVTKSPTVKLCGLSAVIETVFEPSVKEQVLMNLGFRSRKKSSLVNVGFWVKSLTDAIPVFADSCIMNPFSGFFALSISFGIANLSLYILSSKLLVSDILFTKVGSVLSPAVPDKAPTIVLPSLTFTYHCDPSHWTGCPTSPLFLSVTLLNTF